MKPNYFIIIFRFANFGDRLQTDRQSGTRSFFLQIWYETLNTGPTQAIPLLMMNLVKKNLQGIKKINKSLSSLTKERCHISSLFRHPLFTSHHKSTAHHLTQ